MTQRNTDSLKILSYNIHKGFGFRANRFVLPRIREMLETTNADLVFLQEVLGQHDEHAKCVQTWPTAPQFEYLADKLWPHFAYGKNAVYSEGHHGNAILSKYAFSGWENINISNNRYEQRGLLHGIINLPQHKHPFHVICIHFDLFERGREKQVEKLCDHIQKNIPESLPLIVAGDSNDWRQRISHILEKRLGLTEIHKALHGHHARTFPAWKPLLKLDRIYGRGVIFEKAECLKGKPWSEMSDHAALMAEIRV